MAEIKEIRDMIRFSAACAAALVLAAAPAFAQSHQHGAAAGGGHGGMDCPMHGASHGGSEHANDPAHRYAPKMLIEHREHLKLTDAQVAGLEALQAAHKANCEANMAAVTKAEETAAAALAAATPDLAAYEAALLEAAVIRVRCKVDMVKAGQEALRQLTAEQRQQLQNMHRMHHGGQP
jgi:Spy/CpxP family protein refolding chaperone